MSETEIPNDESELTEEDAIPAGAPSRFDLFIENFASKNLSARIKTVSLICMTLLVFTAVAIVYGLSRDFVIAQKGTATASGNALIIEIEPRYNGFVQPRAEVIVHTHDIATPLHTTARLEIQSDKPVYVAILPNSSATQSEYAYELILQKKNYWSLFLEKQDSESEWPEM